MATLKLQHLYDEMKSDFATIAKAANVDLPAMANEAAKSGKFPIRTIWAIFNEIAGQKQNDDNHPTWSYRAANGGGIPRVLPFVAHDWQQTAIYAIADDSHIESLLKRVFVSFGNPDIL